MGQTGPLPPKKPHGSLAYQPNMLAHSHTPVSQLIHGHQEASEQYQLSHNGTRERLRHRLKETQQINSAHASLEVCGAM